MKEHPAGTIVLPLGDLVRYPAFVLSLTTLELPEDTFIASCSSMDVTANLNMALRDMFRGEWAWFIGDDHSFSDNVLTKLLDREEDVVVPMVAQKSPPFHVVAFTGSEDREHTDGRKYPHYFHLDMTELPEDGLHEVHAAGSAGMLVRKHVLDDIGDPWFENPHGTVINDDLEFCRKIRDAGYKIYLDTEVQMTHIGHFKVYPGFRQLDDGSGVWGVYLDFSGAGENRIFMPSRPIAPEDYQ